jgi:CHAT domain-containing protein
MRLPTAILFFFLFTSLACQNDRAHNLQAPAALHTPVDSANYFDSLFHLAEKYETLKKTDSSIYFYEQALKLNQRNLDPRLLPVYIRMANAYQDKFKYDVADKYFSEALVMADQQELDPDATVHLLIDASSCKQNLKDAASALSLLRKAQSIVQEKIPGNTALSARLSTALAAYHFNIRSFDECLHYVSQAIIYLPKDSHQQIGQMYFYMGMVYNEQRKFRSALENFNNAIAHKIISAGRESDDLAKIFLQKAYAHAGLGEKDSMEYYLKQNLKIREAVYGDKDVNTFGARLSLGRFYNENGQLDLALQYYHACLISLVKNFNDHTIESLPRPSATETNLDLVYGLLDKAKAIQKILARDSSRKNFREIALRSYLLADSVFAVFIQNVPFDDPRLSQLESGLIPYPEMTDLAFTLYKSTGEEKFLEHALYLIDRSRAQLLQNALSRVQVYGYSGISETFQKTEGALIKQRSEIMQRLSRESSSQLQTDSLHDALLQVNNRFTRFLRELQDRNPNYYQLRFTHPTVRLREIQSYLKTSHGMMLTYLWGNEKIYAMAIYPDSVSLKIVKRDSSFNESFKMFLGELTEDAENFIKPVHFKNFCTSAYALYRSLLGDFLPQKRPLLRRTHLIISADGPMAAFPFDALITSLPKSDEVDYRLPYLIRSYPVSYAYSVSTLLQQRGQGRKGSRLLALGFAGNGWEENQRQDYTNLPGTEREIMAIKEVMKNSTNEYYLKEEASETNFKKRITSFNIVHLALHGVADTANVLESKLIFRKEADRENDGQLYAHELYALDLKNLDLAVLSACESGIGKQQTGEGVMSMARGFAYAGCPSLVISLWKINDRTTAKVMSDFYRYLSQGEKVNVALAQSKAGYVESAKELYSHPAYWAAFLQVGDIRDFSEPNTLGIITAILLSTAILVSAFLIIRSKKLRIS